MPPEFFADWRCECGDLNRDHEAFCFRCGAGRDADEPPTETPSEREQIAREVEAMADPNRRYEIHPRVAAKVAARIRSGPPTETPKACPTCGGEGLAIVKRGAVQEYCARCDGTGIDGGTPSRGLDLDPDPNEGRRLADDLPGSY